ncbi:hypothetical protein Y032_0477g2183 [Ancylostoma ceylanicum]|uniref:Uncharacterized protein n=1 Tax=Ancylostoma ceylanicum TaxID=53326 RepID=A0A016WW77_9BILA|nr:hypothetical protein Y032_0477g2183 [Ancylostoma ceylanicum]
MSAEISCLEQAKFSTSEAVNTYKIHCDRDHKQTTYLPSSIFRSTFMTCWNKFDGSDLRYLTLESSRWIYSHAVQCSTSKRA